MGVVQQLPDVVVNRISWMYFLDETSSRPWSYTCLTPRPVSPGTDGPIGQLSNYWHQLILFQDFWRKLKSFWDIKCLIINVLNWSNLPEAIEIKFLRSNQMLSNTKCTVFNVPSVNTKKQTKQTLFFDLARVQRKD